MKQKFHLFSGLIWQLIIFMPSFAAGQTPDDSPAAKSTAKARLRSMDNCSVCDDTFKMTKSYGSYCNSREFKAPAILEAPRKQWEVNPGWWGVWQPFVVGNFVLTGSCNNDGNEGLSAFDINTGKLIWRISNICATGNRRGSTGFVSFFELPSGEVMLMYPRDDGTPTDYYVIDVKKGKIVRSLTPVKRGPTRSIGNLFTVLNQSTTDGYSYISTLGIGMDKILWQNKDFKLAMTNKLDPFYEPTFSASASSAGLLFITARSILQEEPATRQLHAIDIKTGKTVWRHMQQPIITKRGNFAYRSDDGIPMVVNNKIIIRIQDANQSAVSMRALDMHTGRVLWTTIAIAGQELSARIGVCNMIVTVVKIGNGKQELRGYNTSDGSLAWHRPMSEKAHLTASSGGAFYVTETLTDKKATRLEGFDGKTGTQLWSADFPEHYFGLGTEWNIEDAKATTPNWTINEDGAIYGVTLKGLYKLK